MPKLTQKCGFHVLIKILCILFLFQMMKVKVLHTSVKTACSSKLWFSSYGSRWSHAMRFQGFSNFNILETIGCIKLIFAFRKTSAEVTNWSFNFRWAWSSIPTHTQRGFYKFDISRAIGSVKLIFNIYIVIH